MDLTGACEAIWLTLMDLAEFWEEIWLTLMDLVAAAGNEDTVPMGSLTMDVGDQKHTLSSRADPPGILRSGGGTGAE